MRTLVLIGDIVSSRSIKDREEIQHRLRCVLHELNAKNPLLSSPYTVTLGDEFQAVFARADHVFYDVITIMNALYPTKIRFSFGVGEIVTAINRQQAIGMDGPAFHLARAGIVRLKKSGALLTMSGITPQWEAFVQHSLELVSIEVTRWNEKRLQIASGLIEEQAYIKDTSVYGKNIIHHLAERLGLSDGAIYLSIKNGAIREVLRLFGDVTQILNRELDEARDD